jgi:hypothetical protein
MANLLTSTAAVNASQPEKNQFDLKRFTGFKKKSFDDVKRLIGVLNNNVTPSIDFVG